MIDSILSVLALSALSAVPPETAPGPDPELRVLQIEFLYLDLSECTRCVDTGAQVEQAMELMAPVLAELGWTAKLRKVHVTSAAAARELRLVTSPTVRIDGKDAQIEFRESQCKECGSLCADAGSITCREWRHRDKWYPSPPRALFVEAIIHALRDSRPAGTTGPERAASLPPFVLPENLERFFATTNRAAPASPCCTPKVGGSPGDCCPLPSQGPTPAKEAEKSGSAPPGCCGPGSGCCGR